MSSSENAVILWSRSALKIIFKMIKYHQTLQKETSKQSVSYVYSGIYYIVFKSENCFFVKPT